MWPKNNLSCKYVVIIISSNYAPNGGGIFVWKDNSNVILDNVQIINNSANYGAGIKINMDAIVSLTNSTISGNSAQLGGGVYSDQVINFSFVNGSISDNSATSKCDGLEGGESKDTPYTSAPSKCNQALNQLPLNPVCPVIKVFLLLNNCTKLLSFVIVILPQFNKD